MRIYSMVSLSLLLATCLLSNLTAQSDPIKWGKIDDDELAMTVYEPDTSASALVLCNFGDVQFNLTKGDIRYDFSQHKRIKILKRAGFDQGDVAIPVHSSEKIRGLQVQVFTPDGEKYSLKNSEIFEEKVSDNWSLMKFSASNLTEGAIMEYRYSKESEFFTQLPEWYFQEDIPTAWSEYRLAVPEWFDYIALTQGRNTDIHETNTHEQTMTVGSSGAGSGSGQTRAKIYTTRYAMKDVEGLKKEGFITTMDDYYSRVRLQLQGITWPNQAYKPFLSTWPELAKNIMENQLDEHINKNRSTKDLFEAISSRLEGVTDPDEKVRAVYNFLTNTMEWDGRYSKGALDKLDDCFERKTATSGELNLMFISLVKKLGIEVYPLMVSTRSHGRTIELYPIWDQFNHLMALVKYKGELKVVDVGNKNRPIGLSRMNAFNGRGWALIPEQPLWVTLPTPTRESVTVVKGTLSEEGVLEGSMQSRQKGFAAVDGRDEIADMMNSAPGNVSGSSDEDEGEEEQGSLRERYPDIELTDGQYSGLEDPEVPLGMIVNCRIPGVAIVNGDFIYFSPIILPAFNENPFKQEKRTYPVDVPYTISERYIIDVTIPEGYEIEESPEDIRMVLPNDDGTFEIVTKLISNKVNINCNLTINKIQFQPEEYPGLKKFIDLVMEKQGEQIVLHKVTK
ncbi:MAG: DUF3858 domain-containing protein [Saprospiraceae bacterium]|nr:DUF3858 domain-containing protein [Saprospiraceae bacterium]